MHTILRLIAMAIVAAAPLRVAAQTPDTTARRDSAARADSIRADSLRLVRELERIRGEARPIGPLREMGPDRPPQPSNPNLLPNISVIGDIIADVSPDGSTQESGRRFDIREVELALGAAVDPYFRADFILGLHDEEGIAIEEAYLSTLSLPWSLMVRAGRFHLPLGKQNTTHRAELHTIEYPWVVQRFLGPEGGKGTGLWISKVMAPLGFYQELILTGVESVPDEHHHAEHEGEEEEAVPAEPANKELSGLGYTARFRNYWDLSEATNVELSFSGATGKRAEPFGCQADPETVIPCFGPSGESGVNARQSLLGADFTFRWRPLQQGLYKSFILQAEVMRQFNEAPALPPGLPLPGVFLGPSEDITGAYVFARHQLTRRLFLGCRFDWIESSVPPGDTPDDARDFRAISGYFTMFPSEFSKIVFAYENVRADDGSESLNRLIVQATIAIGPHRPHPF